MVSAAQARMRPLGVVVAAPAFEDGAGMRQRAEPGLVQKLVTVVAAGSAAETWNVTMSDRSQFAGTLTTSDTISLPYQG